jgi:hypothetical protein
MALTSGGITIASLRLYWHHGASLRTRIIVRPFRGRRHPEQNYHQHRMQDMSLQSMHEQEDLRVEQLEHDTHLLG